MYLKELTLRGFKSFANPTTLRFKPGITAVVGPNGSGKSNLVDALAWVMGEQGARALRGSSMQDVIFAGTATRPQLGRAQVSLTIDNSDHALNIDYSEVTITRTIYRNGGSEYSLNGSPARLMDIQDLLSDAGLGSQMHVIVGQGQLSRILNADPQGHRAIIDEAAGILKHRKRKERSLKRLAITRQNLGRLSDVIAEIDKQMHPLERQAKAARRADDIQARIRQEKGLLLAEDIRSARADQDAQRARLSQIRSDLHSAQMQLARTKMQIENLEQSSGSANPIIERLSDHISQLDRYVSRIQSVSQLATERRDRVSERLEREGHVTSDPDVLEQRVRETQEDEKKQEEAVRIADSRLQEATHDRADSEAQLASIRHTIVQLRQSAKKHEGTVSKLMQLVAQHTATLAAGQKRLAELEDEKKDVSRTIAGLKDQQAYDQSEDHQSDIDAINTQLTTVGEQISATSDKLQDASGREKEVSARKIRFDARADALGDTIRARHESNHSSHSSDVHGEKSAQTSLSSLGALADFLRIAPGWEEAFSRALWLFADAEIVASDHDLEDHLSWIADHPVSRHAYLVPTRQSRSSDESHSSTEDSDLDRDAAQSIVPVARLLMPSANGATEGTGNSDPQLVQHVEQAVISLVQGIGATRDRQTAVSWFAAHSAEQTPEWRAIVTHSGEVITPVGAVAGSLHAPSDLTLAARRTAALHQSADAARELTAIQSEETQIRAKLATLREKNKELSDQLTAVRDQQARSQEHQRMLAQQISDQSARLNRISDALVATRASVDQAMAAQNEAEKSLAQAQASGASTISLSDYEQQETQIDQKVTHLRDREMHCQLAQRDAHRRLDSLNRQIGLLQEEVVSARVQAKRVHQVRSELTAQISQLDDIIHQAPRVEKIINACRAQAIEKRNRVSQQASEHDHQLSELRKDRDQQEPVVARLEKQEHDCDLARERTSARLGELAQKARDDVGMNMDEVQTAFPLPQDGFDRSEHEQALAHEQSRLAHLGKVNPLAGQEFDALQERRSYLASQRDDVARTCEELKHIVSGLDSTMQKVFQSAFSDIESAFERIFAQLFPGGQARLKLDDPDHLLTTGVIVQARPAGKRVRELSLLSGGEKSLTALALLLAIFEARPSPFYVMDEVEAALDDINLTRLLSVLRKLKDSAQLIIITHQQRTMSIADMLYGVSMRADGVSAVMAQELTHHDENSDE
jgi:chromosome segregation protein